MMFILVVTGVGAPLLLASFLAFFIVRRKEKKEQERSVSEAIA
jgi:LPXTG-motif cell wall-anchored protein